MQITDTMKNLISVAAFLVFATAFAALLIYLTGGSLTTILSVSGFTALLLGIAVLKSRYHKLDRAIKTFFGKYFLFSFWLLLSLAPLIFFRWLSDVTVATPRFVQVILFLLWAGLLTAVLMFISTERKREKLFRFLERVGVLAPYVYCLNAFVVAALFFATLTYLMAGRDLLTFTDMAGNPIAPAELSIGGLLDFFVWHFLDAVPLLKINTTLNWKIQVSYTSSAVGFIVLLFKIVVIIPVISAFRGYWKHRQVGGDTNA